MSDYVQGNLKKDEAIIAVMEKNGLYLLGKWIYGVLFFWIFLIPLISAILATVEYSKYELVVTNKRLIGKVGAFTTSTLDAPLNKIQTINSTRPLIGKIFNYGTLHVSTAGNSFNYNGMKNVDAFKSIVSTQMDQFEEDYLKKQAEQMSQALANSSGTRGY